MSEKVAINDRMLNKLLRDGFVLPHDKGAGLVVLIRGKAGTGKSTLALQLLDQFKSKAPRCYCTLEQSKEDVQFKLASMWAAQAIKEARIPAYTQKLFVSGRRRLREILANSIKSFEQDKGISTALDNGTRVRFPLYDELSPTQSNDAKRAGEQLAEAIATFIGRDENAHVVRPFTIIGSRSSSGAAEEGPVGMARGRVLRAVALLDAIIKGSTKPKRPREDKPIVVVDGLSLLSWQDRETVEMQGIIERMRRHFQIGVLVYEPSGNESPSLDHQADMVIELAERSISEPAAYLIHELCIRKSRYQEAALGEHQFKIRGHGVALFPSLHFQVQHLGYMDMELGRSASTKGWTPGLGEVGEKEKSVGSLIDMIFSPKPGESVVLLGSRNSFKTQLCLDFLACGCWGCPLENKTREMGLLVSLIDNAPVIERGLSCPWRKSKRGGCQRSPDCTTDEAALLKHARAFCQRPGCITPSEFFHYLRERLEYGSDPQNPTPVVQRVVFWDLTQMDYRFPLFHEDKMLLPAMLDRFKTDKIKSLFMGAGNADNTKAASAMADHVLFCWRSASNSKTHIGAKSSLMLYVDRASASSNQSGKALFRIPVYANDKLKVPLQAGELKKLEKEGGYRVNLPVLMRKKDDDDKDQIDRITNMQGVA